MNVVDIIIILFFITALVRGVELGVVRQICSTTALFVGLLAGVMLQGQLIHLAHSPSSKALLSLVIIITSIGIFSSIGEYVGALIKLRIERARRLKVIDTADKTLGSILAGLTLLVIVWLGAAIFSNAPMAAGLEKQVKGSVVIAQLNKSLPAAPNVVARIGHLIDPNGFPNVFTGLEPAIDTNAPLPSIGDLDPAVQAARASTVKIEGTGCGGISQGSGFVADTNLVITNAHVVAGVTAPTILDGKGKHAATVIWFDPDLDIAVLQTSNLGGKPLNLLPGIAKNGTASAIIGYPGGGDFTAQPATILDSFKAIGRNIYNQGNTEREVYSIKGIVRPGNSGGPLIDKDGNVIGVIFAESTSYDNVGYALTMDNVIKGLDQARSQTKAASTGSCTR